ncbi:hypothetical protein LO772_21390 [Yinghuangia sp. ASG 101]|uniref:hypothetical protein n=1 Tax=Yinghuangia sp. ASG 101 TaxID=2896848 RepID=UPI001E36400A|nr:hypothetical protein [Yinghuangia sp. ASG 101]UGQ09489.1 hypothetical protein LO772_21390 [Yinghuangia sp. ASG 101]
MRRRLRAPVVLVLLLWMFASACSSDEPKGFASEPTATILEQSRAAAKSATAVHIAGTWISQRVEYQIDMRIKNDGAAGEITTADTKIGLLRVGEDLFVRGDATLYQPRDGRQDPDAAASAEVLHDKYVKVPPDDPAYARFGGFTRLHPLLDDMFLLSGEIKKDGRKDVRGVETILLSADKGGGGEMYVSLGDKPFPMRYSPGTNSGRLDLYEYDQDFPVAMPGADQLVDYGSLNPSPAPSTGTDTDDSASPSPSGTGKSGSGTSSPRPSGSATATAGATSTRSS